MTGDAVFEELNEVKANTGHIYDQLDPRAYFRELKKLGYAIPDAAQPIFQQLISYLRLRRRAAGSPLNTAFGAGSSAIVTH